MNQQNIKQLLLDLFSNYLNHEQIKELLGNKIKAKAWYRLFSGYTEQEIEESFVSIYSHFPNRLPSIQQIKETCLDPLDKVKHQQDWQLIMDQVNQPNFYQISDRLQKELSDQARLALKSIGGLQWVRNELDPQYLIPTQLKFLDWCQTYKEQLQSGLIQPLPIKDYDYKPTEFDNRPLTLDEKAYGATFLPACRLYREKHGNIPPNITRQLTEQIKSSWQLWDNQTEQGVKDFKKNFIKTHPWLNEQLITLKAVNNGLTKI
ncbi:MAG: hypothetical protein QNJ37_04740 [Crocosphaera sp.]|nr:hypothetical protein [Crocosphaera sp.]